MNAFRLYGGSLLALLAVTAMPAGAANYVDTTGDVAVPGSPFPNLDIISVDVTNNATTLFFKINLAGDPVATDWGKYMIGIDSVPGSGDPAGNGWGRPIGMSSGMDYWVGSWVDSGNGVELRNWVDPVWNLQSASYSVSNPDQVAVTKDTSSVTISFLSGALPVSIGSTFFFDVYTSGGGGGDSAVDAAANPAASILDWGNPYNSGANVLSYTLTDVPEPASAGMLMIVCSAAFIRRRMSTR